MDYTFYYVIFLLLFFVSAFFLGSRYLPVSRIRRLRGMKAALYSFYLTVLSAGALIGVLLGSVPASDPGHTRAGAALGSVLVFGVGLVLAAIISFLAFCIGCARRTDAVQPTAEKITAIKRWFYGTFGGVFAVSLVMLCLVLKKEGKELYVWSDEARQHRDEFAINLPTHNSITNYREVPILMPGFDKPMGLHMEFDLHYEGYRSLDYPSGIETNLSPAYFSLNGKVQPPYSFEDGQQEREYYLGSMYQYYAFNDSGTTHVAYDLWLDQSLNRQYTTTRKISFDHVPPYPKFISLNPICKNGCGSESPHMDWDVKVMWVQYITSDYPDMQLVLVKALREAHSKALDPDFWLQTKYNLTPEILRETGHYAGCSGPDDTSLCVK